MTEKYIDLAEEIIGGSDRSNTVSFRIGATWALEWLDDHPDQVPGRKKFPIERVEITDTEAYELYQSAKSFSLEDFKLALESIDGIETVDDPEPTNADLLADDLRDGFVALEAWEVESITKLLTKRGWVKAPEAGGGE